MQPTVLASSAVGWLDSVLTGAKPLLPIPVLALIVPLLWWVFRGTWKELDDDATRWRAALAASQRMDLRPLVAMVLCGVILTLQEYYGGRLFFDQAIHPWLV